MFISITNLEAATGLGVSLRSSSAKDLYPRRSRGCEEHESKSEQKSEITDYTDDDPCLVNC